MLTIENIKDFVGTKVYMSKTALTCINVEEFEDTFVDTGKAYLFSFDLYGSTNGIELVIWLYREWNYKLDGYEVHNNLVDGTTVFKGLDINTKDEFVNSLESYLDEIENDIRKNFY